MAITNQERVGKALELLKDGVAPFVERELKAQDAQGWLGLVRQSLHENQTKLFNDNSAPRWDAASVLAVLWNQWNAVFRKTLGNAERSLVSELCEVRNKWAHQQPFSSDDTDRALDSIARLLTAVSATQSAEVNKMKIELRRLVYEEQIRGEKRKASGGSLVEAAAVGSLRPWREIVTPHDDVAKGRYQQAEFAADLWQVYLGEGADEYRDPREFFRRTYLTDSLTKLLLGAVQRLSGQRGDPVVQLQTNFGGGKTHSMLALYHLFSGTPHRDLAGIEDILTAAGSNTLPKASRVVLVGNKISPGNPVTKKDGTIVRTLWGELAYQLGGKKAFNRVREDDAKATSPGDVLRELLNEHSPCLILIDEWVAYARQLHDQSDLPAGSFETQFTFAQTVTEAAKAAKNCLLVVSLPASETRGSPHTQTDDVEVGGVRGREALDRIRNVVGRLESAWRPATAEEGFEIVRRRLFEPLTENDAFKQRDVTARAFAELYRNNGGEFPPDSRSIDYEERLKKAYPIHPEIFDRLYTDWSTLIKFQRTRGVLRLMAAVIHSLWDAGDRSPLILPSTIPIDDPRVRDELTRYLSDNWVPIIESDVDGPRSLPRRIDAEHSGTLGRYSATRRVARTVYLGSAPVEAAAHRGLEDRQVRLGCVMPGEPINVFGDALRRLASAATYLYQDGPRAWYSTQQNVTKRAEDLAEQLKRDPDRVADELENWLRKEARQTGDFARVHVTPRSSADVPDDLEVRLVVLDHEKPFSREQGSAAEWEARNLMDSRGNSPRLYQNTLIFAAVDKLRWQDLEEALRKHLAWKDIVEKQVELDLSPHQVSQAKEQLKRAESAVEARLPEAYQWLLVPTQHNPNAPVELTPVKLGTTGSLAERASKKLKSEELLLSVIGPTILRRHLDQIPLWRENHVELRELVQDFARYVYLPRVAGPDVVLNATRDGVKLLTWESDTFAYADEYDANAKRYRGLRVQELIPMSTESRGLLVKPQAAREQLHKETNTATGSLSPVSTNTSGGSERVGAPSPVKKQPTRFHATVTLDSARVGRDAGRIADEVISHLTGIIGAEVEVVLEIEANIPGGASEQVVRTVTENSRTLKFDSHQFEAE